MRRLACVLVLAGCGRSDDRTPPGAAAPTSAAPLTSAHIPLGGACCDPAVYDRLVLGDAAMRDARQLDAAGGERWSSRGALDLALCGVPLHPSDVNLTVFRHELAQATWACAEQACGPTTCADLFAACTRALGPPRLRRGSGPTPELARYVTPTAFVRIAQADGACTIAVQDARVTVALDAVLDAATAAAHAASPQPK